MRNCTRADRAECKKKKGQERDFEDFWKEISNRQPVRERMNEGETYNTDSIDICKVPKETSKEELLKFLLTEAVEIFPDNLVTTTFPETWRIINIPTSEMMHKIVNRLHGKQFGKRNLLFLPIQLSTPMKNQQESAKTSQEKEGAPDTGAGENVNDKSNKTEKQKKADEEADIRRSVEVEKERLRKEKEEAARMILPTFSFSLLCRAR